MNTKELKKALFALDVNNGRGFANVMRHTKAISRCEGVLAYTQMQIAAKKRDIRRAAVRLALAKTACRDLEAADPYPYGARHTPEARYRLRLVVCEHRAALKRLAKEQKVLKQERARAGIDLTKAQQLAVAFLKEPLDSSKS